MPETDKAPLSGQASTQEAIASAAEAAKADSSTGGSPFFEDLLPDGKKKVWNTRDEFIKDWNQSKMFQSDYTRKTQEVASIRKQYEESQRKFEDERKQFLEMRKRYDGWDEKLRSRPDVQRMIEQYLEQPENPAIAFERARGYVDETKTEMEKRIEAIEKRYQEDQQKREIEEAFAGLKTEFPDADENAIMERLQEISDGNVNKLIRQLYYSHKGQLSPAQVEQRVVEDLKKKEAAKMVPAGAARSGPPPKFKNANDARAQAFKDMGLDTGG